MTKYEKIIKEYGLTEHKKLAYQTASSKYYNKIYAKIKNKEPIDFSCTYFDGFSLADYRKKYNIDNSTIIKIYVKNAMFAIFDGVTNQIDFSNIEFIASDRVAGISFNNSVFLGGRINFSYSTFDNTDLSFDDCYFYNCRLLLVYCDKIKDLTFINSKKQNSEIIFFGVTVNDGNINFSKMNSFLKDGTISGNIIVENCNFINATINFDNNLYNNAGYLLFINNKFQLQKFEFFNSNFYGIVFYKCTFDNETLITDCIFEYFILQECVLRDVFKITYEELPTSYNTKFCFLNTIFNGYFNLDNEISKNLLSKQKKFCIDYSIEYENESESRFYLNDTSYMEKSIQANNLSEIFLVNGKFKEQDRIYSLSRRYRNLYRIQEKIYCLKSIKLFENKNSFEKIFLYVNFFFQLLLSSIIFAVEFILMDIICGNYATNPLKFLGWLIGIIVGFGIIFMLFFDLNNISYIVAFPKDSNQFELSFLISVSNFFQIELIEKYQNYTMYLISSFEKILGIIVLSLFTVSYTRKVIK